MSHREDVSTQPEEEVHKAPPSYRSRQTNAVTRDGGRPRWRPCQLHNQEQQNHVHHYYQQAHHHQPGSSRLPPRHRKRHVPGQAQRRQSDGSNPEPKHGQQAHQGVTRYRRNGERSHQHKTRQQKELYGIPATQQLSGASLTNHPSDTLTCEASPQDLQVPQVNEEPAAEEEKDSPGLLRSASTESSFNTHTDQAEDQQGEREDEGEREEKQNEDEECLEGKDQWEECEEPGKECHSKEDQCSEDQDVHSNDWQSDSQDVAISTPNVPPLTAAVHQSLTMATKQPSQSLSEPLNQYKAELREDIFHMNSTGYTAMKSDMVVNSASRTQSYHEIHSESSPVAFPVSYAEPNSEFSTAHYPELYNDFSPEPHRESFTVPLTEPYQYPTEEQNAYEMRMPHHKVELQPSTQVHPKQSNSVGSRLHHYNDQSGDEDDTPGGGRVRIRKSISSHSVGQVPLSQEKKPEGAYTLPRQHRAGKLQDEHVERRARPTSLTPNPLEDSCGKPRGDAISLAIRDIKEAIQEVKTKTVRSPYTPDKPKEPVWVMRQDVTPVEESHPQSPLQTRVSTLITNAPVPDPAVPVGAESSRTPESQDADVSPRLPPVEDPRRNLALFPTYVDVPGPCDPEDLIDGIIFAANYLGSTQLLSQRTPTKSARMQQAQEAMSRVKAAQKQANNRKKGSEGESPSMTEVDLFMSTQRIKVLNAETQETMMDHPLRTISYIADIGNMVVLMARRRMIRSQSAQDHLDTAATQHTNPTRDDRRQYKMVCHVFESEDAQLIAQSIGQAFSVAYQEFLRANGIDPEDLSQREYSDLLNTQDMYNDDLIHFSKSENCRDVYIEKQKGEILGVVIVESGWGSILPTVIIASMQHGGPAEKSGRLNIGDQIMTVNGTSLVGLPLSTCQSIIKGLKSQCRIKMNIVRCPPVTMVLIRRPDLRYQLGFSVQNGIICSLMRGGIAERGGVRVGHRIIEINSQSVVATPHEKIVHILSNAVGEIHMKTMPAAMYRLLTAQEQPVYI
ncbi:amyloid-beta A4 precursor protein-binding family A member 1 [Chanos chanos]|uniref:Amyloid-beta A4 precursor protein-binding family A member 1 n=1 Tax=Chanos chanos TaxID=29144 RepID=A0A6J2UUM0_CHACN|nr:amyloid-beta A4 precursor protein-binding family A member 1-like [Chanos chanos]